MIINHFHIKGVAVTPNKTDAPLVVDANAPLAFPVPGKPFKMGRGGDPKKLNACRTVELRELSHCDPLNILRKLLRKKPLKIPSVSLHLNDLIMPCYSH
jgi:hypothetical protein